mmetsp:Transcript_62539/g.158001  ORF Transcript_62539/g.158001 Transcript_62539/m.158001 type:complete len:95 (+) Transcript_62539:368-652(+)
MNFPERRAAAKTFPGSSDETGSRHNRLGPRRNLDGGEGATSVEVFLWTCVVDVWRGEVEDVVEACLVEVAEGWTVEVVTNDTCSLGGNSPPADR